VFEAILLKAQLYTIRLTTIRVGVIAPGVHAATRSATHPMRTGTTVSSATLAMVDTVCFHTCGDNSMYSGNPASGVSQPGQTG